MNHSKFLSVFILALTIWLIACGGSHKTPAPIVTPVLSSISVSATSIAPALGTSTQLSGTGTYNNGSSQPLTTITWSTSNEAVATVSTSGVVTTKAQGTAIITATVGNVSATITITVGPPVLASLSLSPTNASVALGLGQPLTATGTMTDGTTATGLALTWTSSVPTVATVANGLITTKGVGTTTITVAVGSISVSTTVTVLPAAIASIAVTPSNPSIAVSAHQQFAAIATYTDSTTKDVTATATWSSTSVSIASLDSATPGLFHGLAGGQVDISATQAGITGKAVLSVTSNVANTASFVYATVWDSTSRGYLLKSYAVSTDGTIQEIASITANTQWGGMVTDGTRLLYLDPGHNSTIQGYIIDRSTGALTPIALFVPTRAEVSRVVLDPSGKWMYGFDDSTNSEAAIYVYSVDQTTGVITDTGQKYQLLTTSSEPTSSRVASFMTNQNGTVFYFGGRGGTCTGYSGTGPCQNLHAYRMDTTTGALAELATSPFGSRSPQTAAMATKTDGTTLWVSLDAFRIISYSLDQVTGAATEFDYWWPYGQGSPIQTIVPRADYFYAGQGYKLLWVTPAPTTGVLGGTVWSYTNPDTVQDVAVSSQSNQLFVADRSGISSFMLDSSGQPTFAKRTTVTMIMQLVAIGKPN